MKRYDPKQIESRWQSEWEKKKVFKADIQRAKKPFYNLMMFPYPSGEGLHVGHVYAFGGADTFGRFKKMQGFSVFEPMGFDSFGIHSENYAIKVGKHPKSLIEETTTYFREKQLKRLGSLFDWDHELITSETEYYRWTQWLFIQLFKAGLAVRQEAAVGWCPSCKTTLADEQVIAGHCERCKTQVIQRQLEQWFFKITNYAERLLKNLDWINWSETTKTMQRNWIGKKPGVEIEFRVEGLDKSRKIKVFTTRPDTIFGATFLVVAPEHPLVADLRFGSNAKKVMAYVQKALVKTELDRIAEGKEKTGEPTGYFAINPLTKEKIPIWIADYVLMGYGTGAIMAVPAHDQRDYDFAKEHGLDIIEVIRGGSIEKEAYVGEGRMINSGEFNGLGSKEAIQKVSKYIEKNQLGSKAVNYHLRDWLISRQRYWGPPIPMIYCERCKKEGKSWFTTGEAKDFTKKFQISSTNNQTNHKSQIPNSKQSKIGHWSLEFGNSAYSMHGWYPVPEKDLPVKLPHLDNYQPKGTAVSPLSSLPDFVKVKCPGCGRAARRETDVSDTFLDSSWYFLRYPTVGSPSEDKVAFDQEITKKWLPVDMYIGGNEHAVLHLLYTRFVTMALHDIGILHFEEPFKKFRAHGLVIHGGAKMSKSRGNVVNPNEFMDAYGADSLRMYLLFLGPYDQGGDFSDRAISGVYRFLNRVWTIVGEVAANKSDSNSDTELEKAVNKLIKKVGEDIEGLKFNTAIASMMEFVNLIYNRKDKLDKSIVRNFILLLAPFAPHIAEELWVSLDGKFSVHQQSWPKYDPRVLQEERVTIVIQVNGRFRDKLEAPKHISKEEATRLALDRPKIKLYTKDRKVKRSIWIEGRLLNLVTGD